MLHSLDSHSIHDDAQPCFLLRIARHGTCSRLTDTHPNLPSCVNSTSYKLVNPHDQLPNIPTEPFTAESTPLPSKKGRTNSYPGQTRDVNLDRVDRLCHITE